MSALIARCRWLPAALLFLLLAGCARQLPPAELYSAIAREIRQGNLPEAERQLLSLGSPAEATNEFSWRLGLLKAELSIAKGQFDAARELLSKLTPPLPDHADLEGRRRLQLAYVSIYTRKYPVAAQLLVDAEAIAPAAD